MNPIGGYFELELKKGIEYHAKAIKLNLGRTAFEYILRAKNVDRVFLPYYTCDVILEPVVKTGTKFEFYHIDVNFEPVFDYTSLEENDYFLYTNYFGLKDFYIEKLAVRINNLIIDNSQAFYSKPLPNVDLFYSARKFFGVPDGAYLYTNKKLNQSLKGDVSYQRFEHLVGRIDLGAKVFYRKFVMNEDSLTDDLIRSMSKLTQRLLSSIDYNFVSKRRQENFNFLHSRLGEKNLLNLNLEINGTPMVYPLLLENGIKLKNYLIQNEVYIASYWPNVRDWVTSDSFEMNLLNNLICIPVDQRYNINHMNRIIKMI